MDTQARKSVSARGITMALALLFATTNATAAGGALPPAACAGTTVDLTPATIRSSDLVEVVVGGSANATVTVVWELLNGNISLQQGSFEASGPEPTKRFELGDFPKNRALDVRVSVAFFDGACPDRVFSATILNSPPAASILPVAQAYRGDRVTIAASVSDVDDDAITLTWTWDGLARGEAASFEETLTNLATHTAKLVATDGTDLVEKTRSVAAKNRLPTIDAASLAPASVAKGQNIHVEVAGADGDKALGYGSFTLKLDLSACGGGTTSTTGNSIVKDVTCSTAGTKTFTVKAQDEVTSITQNLTVLVRDVELPDLTTVDPAPRFRSLLLVPGSGAETATRAGDFNLVRRPLATTSPSEIESAIAGAKTSVPATKVVAIANPPRALPASLAAIVREAARDGMLIVATSPAAAGRSSFNVEGLAAMPEVLTIAYGPDAQAIRTGRGPSPDLVAKPDLAVAAPDAATAARLASEAAVALMRGGIQDPLLVKALLRKSAEGADPFATGAGLLGSVIPQDATLPTIPLTPYLDFGVVNDARAQGARVELLNANALVADIGEILGVPLGSRSGTVEMESTFYYAPDLLRVGFQALAGETPGIAPVPLTERQTFVAPEARIEVDRVLSDLASLIENVNGFLVAADDALTGGTIATTGAWDATAIAATQVRDARRNLETATVGAARTAAQTIRSSANAACAASDSAEVCLAAGAIADDVDRVEAQAEHAIGRLASFAGTANVTYLTSPALTAAAPHGLYVGWTTISTTAGANGVSVAAPFIVPSALILTGTTQVVFTYRDGTPVSGTSVEAIGGDLVSNLFVTIPTGVRERTDALGHVTFPYLAPSESWRLAGYYAAGTEFAPQSGRETLDVVQSQTVERELFGPSMTELLLNTGLAAATSARGFILARLNGTSPVGAAREAYFEGLARLADKETERVSLASPAIVQTRVVDDVAPLDWSDPRGTGILAETGWLWEARDDDLHGRATHGLSPAVLRYPFKLPDATYARLSVHAELGTETRGIPILVATATPEATAALDAVLAAAFADGEILSPEALSDKMASLFALARERPHVRIQPLTHPAIEWSVTVAGQYVSTRQVPTPYGLPLTRVEDNFATEFHFAEGGLRDAALTLIVVPAPVNGGGVDPATPLGAEILFRISTRVLAHGASDALSFEAPADTRAEDWTTVVQVAKTRDVAGAAATAERLAAPARSGVRVGFNDLLDHVEGSALDAPGVRALDFAAGLSNYVVEAGSRDVLAYRFLGAPVSGPSCLDGKLKYDPLKCGFGESPSLATGPLLALESLVKRLAPWASVPQSYLARTVAEPILAASANHDLLVLPFESVEPGANAIVEIRGSPTTSGSAPLTLRAWNHPEVAAPSLIP